MRNLKKFLALVLAMMMTLSLMVTVNAANVEFEDGETITDAFLEDITVLAGMGVFEGYGDGTFKPTDTVTRAEMAAIVYRLVTGDAEGTSDALHGQYGSFKDVADDKWYAGYVGYCANAGLILGYGDGTFRPSNPVTGYEALVMLLRAIGYDQPNEFSKSDWRTHAASIATQRGLLTKINSTRYKGTLSQPALREVVGEIAFQAANKDCVVYTPAFGYQTTNLTTYTGEGSTSLGRVYYGLTSATRIVVGNQATGEGATILGNAADSAVDYFKTSATDAQKAEYTMYDYPGQELESTVFGNSGNGKGTVQGDTVVVPDGLVIDAKTGLELFGHKITVWYDGTVDGLTSNNAGTVANTAAKRSEGFHTYAYFDRAMAATVVARGTDVDDDETDNAGVGSNVFSVAAAGDPKTAFLGMAAQEAGFSVNLGGATASGGNGLDGKTVYTSDEFSRIDTAASQRTAKAASKIYMYTVISNNADKTVDLIINLNAEVGEITEKDTSIARETLTIGETNGAAAVPTGSVKSAFDPTGGTNTEGVLWVDKLAPGSTTTLGAIVIAREIKGTTLPVAAGTNVETTQLAVKDYIYQLDSPIATTTATVNTYRNLKAGQVPTGTIVTSEGTLGQSGMYNHVLSACLPQPRTLVSGVAYTFYLDEMGRFIAMEPANDYKFLYTTFADYAIGGLGTGSSNYAVTGVDWDGKIVENHVLTSMTLPITTSTITGPVSDMTYDRFGTSTDMPFPGKTGTPATTTVDRTVGDGYGLLPVTLKDQGAPVSGNQIRPGVNTAYMIDTAGDLQYDGIDGTQFVGSSDDATYTTVDTRTWTITSRDVANGFIRVLNDEDTDNDGTLDANVSYLLTNDTVFHVVSGAGTSDLKVTTYNGIDDLVGDGTSATITASDDAEAKAVLGDQVWFQTVDDKFGNVQTGNNHTIATVILSDTNLVNYNQQSLFYNFDATNSTGAVLAGADADVEQFALYNGGELGYYFIDLSESTKIDGSTPWTTGNNNNVTVDTFYKLTPIDEVNGVTVYKADGIAYVTDMTTVPDGCIANGNVGTGLTYNYIVVNNLSTAELEATVKRVVSVGGATVVDVEYLAAQAQGPAAVKALNRTQITNIRELNNAVSVGYTVNVAVELDGVDVSMIYITDTDVPAAT